MDVLSIGEKIKRKRKGLGMTLKDLAGDRVTTGQISLIESGKSNPSKDLLKYLSKKLNTSIEYLIETEQGQAMKICNYYENMAFCYLFQKDPKGVESCLYKMKEISDMYDLEQIKFKMYFINGLRLYNDSNYDEACENFLISNFGFLKFSMYDEVINSFLYLAYISIDKGNYISAVIHLECAVKIIDKYFLNYDSKILKVYYLIYKSYIELGYIDKSIKYIDKLIILIDKIYNPKLDAIMFMKESEKCMKQDDIDNAIKFSHMSKKYFEELNFLNDRQFIENEISKYLINTGDLNGGKTYLRRAKSIVINYKFDNLFEIYKNFIIIHIRNKDLDKSKYYLNKLKGLFNDNDFEKLIDFYMLKYKVYMMEKDYSKCEVVLKTCYSISKEFGEYKKSSECCLLLSKFYFNMKRFEECKSMINEALYEYEKTGYKLCF